MELFDEDLKTNQKTDNKRTTTIILVLIIFLIILMLGIVGFMVYLKQTAFVLKLNGQDSSAMKNIINIDSNNPNDVYIKNKNVYSILGYCIWNNKDFEMIRLLIEYGADVNYVDKWYSKNKYYERNMLCHAIIGRQTDTVNFLLKYGADISQVQTFTSLKKYGEVECKGPALFYAIMGVDLNGTDIEMVEALLQNKSILDKFIIFVV